MTKHVNENHGHQIHDGERYVQKKRNSPSQLAEELPRYIEKDMPQQHSEFYEGLPYIALGTVDDRGRPWASLLVTRASTDDAVGIELTAPNELEIRFIAPRQDPFVRALIQNQASMPDGRILFAGVGVDFTNRRRNKVAGSIRRFDSAEQGYLALQVSSNQHLGNCPKYITVRTLDPHIRTPALVFDRFDDDIAEPLSAASKAIIAGASTVFLASKHEPASREGLQDERDMGLNHRGGAPGFVRVYEEKRHDDLIDTYLVLPDHSGNRFYQSLGNIQSNRQVGLTFPNFESGDVLYVTGDAENLFDEEAEALMPRVKLVTRIRVTGAVLIEQALSLKLNSLEQYSPYNPPLRLLRSELAAELGVTELSNSGEEVTATLASCFEHSDALTTFRFELSKPVAVQFPGGFGIFDFSGIFDNAYKHMDELNPQAVNDDHIRTWTLSSAPEFDAREKRFMQTSSVDITVKRKDGGLVSNFLHAAKKSTSSNDKRSTLSVPFIGCGGDFSCFSQSTNNGLPAVPNQMLWIAGGAGITPFMSMRDGLINVNRALAATRERITADIILYYAGRDDDINVIRHFLTDVEQGDIQMQISCFQSLSAGAKPVPNVSNTSVEQRRIQESDFTKIDNLLEREVFICGPVSFMQHIEGGLRSVAGERLIINRESYAF